MSLLQKTKVTIEVQLTTFLLVQVSCAEYTMCSWVELWIMEIQVPWVYATNPTATVYRLMYNRYYTISILNLYLCLCMYVSVFEVIASRQLDATSTMLLKTQKCNRWVRHTCQNNVRIRVKSSYCISTNTTKINIKFWHLIHYLEGLRNFTRYTQ